MPLGIAIHNIEITCGRGGPNAAYNFLLYCALQVCLVPLLPLTMASPWEITLMGRKKEGVKRPSWPNPGHSKILFQTCSASTSNEDQIRALKILENK